MQRAANKNTFRVIVIKRHKGKTDSTERATLVRANGFMSCTFYYLDTYRNGFYDFRMNTVIKN